MKSTTTKSQITVAYIRSAVTEREGGLSLRRQRRICEDHAHRLRTRLGAVYADAGLAMPCDSRQLLTEKGEDDTSSN
jgi:hypothetical protein